MLVVVMKYVVCYSGGHSSALVAIETVRRYGKEDVILLNHNISPEVEHEDIKRFKEEVAKYLGIEAILNKYPYQMSGGQRQRVASARAIVTDPSLILADEPTGALDSKTSKDILILIEEINKKFNTTILMVTHNGSIKNMAHKIIQIKDGKITKDYINKNRIEAKDLENL